MIIESKNIVHQPIDVVFDLLKNNITDLVPYLPNVDKIEEKSRNKKGNREDVVSTWTAKAEMPSILKKIAKPDLFSWDDIATWDLEKKKVTYRLESKLASNLYTATGENKLVAIDDNTTEMIFTCEVTPHPENFLEYQKYLLKK